MDEPTLDASHVLVALRAAKRAVHVMEIVEVLELADRTAGKARVREILAELCESGLAKELPGQKYRLGPGKRDAVVAPPTHGHAAARGALEAARPEAARTRAHAHDAAGPRTRGHDDRTHGQGDWPRTARERGERGAPSQRGEHGAPGERIDRGAPSQRGEHGAPGERTDRGAPRQHGERGAAGPQRAAALPDALPLAAARPATPGAVAGWLSMTTRGFGFVTCDDAGPDVFIAPPSVGVALHGDRVEVRARSSTRGREGEIVRVLSRGMTRVAGTLERARHGRGFVISVGDARLPPTILVDGPLPLGTAPGSEVVAQVTAYPERLGDPLTARVLRVMGPRGSAAVEIEKVLVRESVSEEFPPAVQEEALGFPARVPLADVAGREDLRELPLVTIDPDDARDHDDAIFAELLPGGGFHVVVAIADVSHYVRPGSPIDVEAVMRGCSIYLPDRAIPMLPPELSSNLASLVPGEDRLTLAVEAWLGPHGAIERYRFVEGVMRSHARLTYGGMARAMGWTELPERSPEAEAHLPMLRVLAQLSTQLRARRHKRGSLGFDLPESKIVLDERGEPIDVKRQKGDPGVRRAYEVVEDLMLLANETVGEDLEARRHPAVWRIHGAPDVRKIAQLAGVAEALGHPLAEDAGVRPKALQEFLESIEGTPHAQPLGYLLLRSMQQASYSLDNVGHFALAARAYVHFTSPIRRYPDVAVHRVVRALLRSERTDPDALRRRMRPEAVQASRMERRSMTVERDAQGIHKAIVMRAHLGSVMEGVVSGISDDKVSVALDAPFVEVRVPVLRLSDEGESKRPSRWEMDALGTRFVERRSGRSVGLGDRVAVRIDEASVERRETLGTLVSNEGGAGKTRRSEKRVPPPPGKADPGPPRGPRHAGGARAHGNDGGRAGRGRKKRGGR